MLQAAGGRAHAVTAFGYLPMRYGHKVHVVIVHSRISFSWWQTQSRPFNRITFIGFGIPSALARPIRFSALPVTFINIGPLVCPFQPRVSASRVP